MIFLLLLGVIASGVFGANFLFISFVQVVRGHESFWSAVFGLVLATLCVFQLVAYGWIG